MNLLNHLPERRLVMVGCVLVGLGLAGLAARGQTLLGPAGGLEGTFTIDNVTAASAGAAGTWQKATATQTLLLETTTVRSGAGSLRILNTNVSTTGRRVYTPGLATVADGSRLVLQYYRRRPAGTGQEQQRGVAFPSESIQSGYTAATAADTWEKLTYVPTATTTNGDKWALIIHRLASGGDNTLPEYIDDVAVYVGTAVDNVAPDAPTDAAVVGAAPTSQTVSWSAPGAGTDNGGYLVVRGTADPATAPNVNGIYVAGNMVAAGQFVVYAGTNTTFVDTNLVTGTNYFYRIYTVDKAYNYSSALSTSGAPLPPGVPIVNVPPASRTNNAGSVATFTVTASGVEGYRWFAGPTAYSNGGNVSGATSATLVLSNVFAADGRTNIVVVLSNGLGFTTSAPPAALQVIDPAITGQPASQAVPAGTNVTFNVTALGTGTLFYQWQHASTNLPGATNATLLVTNVTSAKAGVYRVVVSNAVGQATSDAATVTLVQNIFSVLTYNVKGNFSTNWTTNAVQVQAIGRQVKYLNPDIITFNEIPLADTHEMTNFITAFLPGYFMVTNSSSDGFIRSVICSRYPITRSQSYFGTLANGASLTNFGYDGRFTRDLFEAQINVPNFTQPLHVFTTHLKSGQAADDTAKRAAESAVISNYFATGFLVTNAGRPYLITGDWNEDVSRPPSGAPKVIFNLTNSAVGFRLTTPVNPVNGQDVTHSIQAMGGPGKRYDYILPSGILFSNLISSQVFRTDLLTNPPPPLLTNDDVTASDHLPVLMVFNNPYAESLPIIIGEPQNQTNNVGAPASFSVSAIGSEPLRYQWRRSDTNLSNGGNISGVTNATLLLSAITSNDVSGYSVVITNGLGAVTSVVATLTIAVPPGIVTQPASQTNALGGTAVFSVGVSGSAPFGYQWRKGSATLNNGGSVSGATSNVLTIANLVGGDATNYTVVVTNIAGSVTSAPATLTVLSAPVITAQPGSRTVLEGEVLTLAVTATSDTPATYQWRFNGGNVFGATNSVYLDNDAQPAEGGDYTVVVANQTGAVTSSVANVIVALSAAPFFPANLVVLRAGDGVQALGAGGNSIYIDQFTTNGVRLSTVGIPETNAAATLIAPNSTSEGWLSRAANGRALAFSGYNTNRGAVASVITATAAAVPRVVGVLNAGGQYSIGGRTLLQYSTGNIRSGATDGSNNFWGAGSASGTYYFGSNAAAATVQSATLNTRVLNAFNGGLYFSTGAGTRGIYAFVGFPTASAAATNMINTGGSSSPYDFAINGNGTLAYIADDSSVASGGGIQKWTNNAGVWSLVYALTNAGSTRGLAVDFDGANPVVYATTTETSSNRLVRLVDTGENAGATTLATAGANQVFRGLDFSVTINLQSRITNISFAAPGTVQGGLTGAPSNPYVVQYSTNVPGTWFNLMSNNTDASGLGNFTDNQATNRARFYRSIQY